jgi:hypothetical protein
VQPTFEAEDYGDFDADSTNVNQIPQPGQPVAQGTPRPEHHASQPPPRGFASQSPAHSPAHSHQAQQAQLKNHFYSRLRKCIRKLNRFIDEEFKKKYKKLNLNIIFKLTNLV